VELAQVGLQVTRRFPAGPGMEIAFMSNGIMDEILVEFMADRNKGAVNHSEFISIGFTVNSMDAMLDVVKSKNIPLNVGLVEKPASRFFTIKDPNAFVFSFSSQNG
jgi:lactoylglutathione lyase